MLYFILAIVFLTVLVLFSYSLNLLILLILAKKTQKKSLLVEKKLENYPYVTIQLPIFNEMYVAKRIIESSIKINYPVSRLEIQVLDDSTDETRGIVSETVNKIIAKGYNIKLLHRKKRTGYKGGALRDGLKKARGEFIAIFDSDFLPNINILENVIPHFLHNKNLGMVQTRWGHINPDYSILTRAQAIGIDSHFAIEQVARFGSDLFINFNGTAGIWRKECIIDAGNWQDDTLTEDLDLSYRATLKGWKMKYIKDIVNDSELPVQLSAYKSQQFRWAKGSIQTAIKLLKKLFRSKNTLFKKIQGFFHLSYYLVHPLLLFNILFTIPVISSKNFIFYNHSIISSIAMFFAIAVFISPVVFFFSQVFTYKNWIKRIKWIPYAIIVGTGIAVNNTFGVIEAIIGKKTPFIRTPKFGINDCKDKWKNKKYKIRKSSFFIMLLELFFSLYSILGTVLAFYHKIYFIIPFFFIYSISFTYIFILGVIQKIFPGYTKTGLKERL